MTPASITFRLQLYSEGVANLSQLGSTGNFLITCDRPVSKKVKTTNIVKCNVFHFDLLSEVLIEKCSF